MGIRAWPFVWVHRAPGHAAADRRQAEPESHCTVQGRSHSESDHMSKRKNTRTLSEIADAFHSLERANIIDSGDLLIEGEQGCEHGEWLAWVATEVDISEDTA